jgi:hypothetical protein
MRGGPGRPARMNRPAIGDVVEGSGRQVRRIQLLVPRIVALLLPAVATPAGPRPRSRRGSGSQLRAQGVSAALQQVSELLAFRCGEPGEHRVLDGVDPLPAVLQESSSRG